MNFDPAMILSAAGATAAAAAITGLIELAKKLIPGLENASQRTYQQIAAFLSLGVVVYAAFASSYPLDPVSIGALGVAWYGIARLATATYDAARTVAATIQGQP
jgi:hypothetical protein